MKAWMAVPALVLVLACATPETILKRAPVVEAVTSLPPHEAAIHVMREWDKHSLPTPALAQYGQEWRITMSGLMDGTAAVIVTASPEGHGSRVALRKRATEWIPQWMRDSITTLPK